MRIRILCVGRLKDGPERQLVDDYLQRAQKSGKSLGYRAVEEIEIPSSSKDDEGTRLLARHTGVLVRLDERGEAWTSQDLSKRLARWRDSGEEAASFVIGGADGTSPAVAKAARHTISLGVQTWPHRLVRVMLAEQIYRALSIEAGSPYHRE
ncbi:MAG TPA: 23S rRNA (pseudouridine(1915)-N(3))-methyltransferase RlmH [Hyphomonadaceae bacterium]|jgi:23S rRNA (pseudouridine1915-N3)-methyltransferase|nr:23S rRNA (pseudouridine(1915)-N(3))-methyltransferase RlmH [Hyphomonadaceae bacterium]